MGRKQRAREFVLDLAEGRILVGDLLAVEHVDDAAFLAQDIGLGCRRLQRPGIAIEIENPVLAAVIGNGRPRQRLVEDVERIGAQPGFALGVDGRLFRRALLPEFPHPAPELRIERGPEAQGLVVAPQRAQEDAGSRGRGPGIGMSGREEPGIAIGGESGGKLLAINHGHLVAVAVQFIGRRHPDNARPQDQSFHRCPLLLKCG